MRYSLNKIVFIAALICSPALGAPIGLLTLLDPSVFGPYQHAGAVEAGAPVSIGKWIQAKPTVWHEPSLLAQSADIDPGSWFLNQVYIGAIAVRRELARDAR